MFASAKNTLSRHQPTNPDPGSVSTTSVQNKQPPAPNASNQNNQSTQTGVKKFSSPKRTPTRHSAAKDFSVWRQACFIMAPKTGSKKLIETWRPLRDLDCSDLAEGQLSNGLCKTMDSGIFDRSRSLHSKRLSCLQVCR